ncbi:MAG: TIGR03620 family F420-dependent LLM class oxidoreductase [Acidimicrobiales bacterium]
MELGKVGVWWSGTWSGGDGTPGAAAAEVEALGYSALWSSAGLDPGVPDRFGRLLAATTRVPVASGILSVWHATPAQAATAAAALDAEHPGRFVLGLGASHAPLVEPLGDPYVRPYSRMVRYLDELDDLGPSVASDRRMLAALGPRMLTLAAERAAGAHPYFVPVEHTDRARRIMGPTALLAPELAVVLEADPVTARSVARGYTEGYLGLPNYINNLRSLDFTDDDLEGGGSDRLVDAIVAWGDAPTIAERVRAFHDAGADHVCIQVVADRSEGFPLAAYRELATVLVDR